MFSRAPILLLSATSTYSIFRVLSLDHSAPRQNEQFTYSPSFTFYEPTSALDSMDQNATVAFQYRFNPEVAFNVQDNFARTSNVYNSTISVLQPDILGPV